MPIEPFELREEPRIERVLIEDPDGIVGIDGRDDPVASDPNGPQVAGGDEPADACHGEVVHDT